MLDCSYHGLSHSVCISPTRIIWLLLSRHTLLVPQVKDCHNIITVTEQAENTEYSQAEQAEATEYSQAEQLTWSLSKHLRRNMSNTQKEENFSSMARIIYLYPSAIISNAGNLGLGKGSIRSLGVNRFDRSGSLCSESLTNVLKTSLFPTFVTSSTERVQYTVVGSTCPFFDTRGRNAGHDINVGSQFAAVFVEGQVVDVVAEGVLNLGATVKGLV
jgi:hypothetical protein